MEKHEIKSETQIHTWMRWYRSNGVYRPDQQIGKQYTYGYDHDHPACPRRSKGNLLPLGQKTGESLFGARANNRRNI